MDRRGIERFAPLAGLAFLVLAVISFGLSWDPPAADDPTGEVVDYWIANESEEIASAFLAALSALFLVWFAGSLRSALWHAEGGSGRLATIAFGGGVIAAVGLLSNSAFEFAAANSAGEVPPQVTQTFSALYEDFFFPIPAGMALMLFAAGAAILRHGALPVALGITAIVIGLLTLTPLGFYAIPLILIWIAVASVLLFLRGDRPGRTRDVEAPPPAAPAA